MDPSLLILTLGVCFCFLSLAVQSHQNVSTGSQSVEPPPPPPPPPPSPRPPPPHHHTPPPTKSVHSPPKTETKHSNHGEKHEKSHGKWTPPIKKKRTNWGKKLGFIFVGVAASLQVCVLAFLLIKRRQLLMADSRF